MRSRTGTTRDQRFGSLYEEHFERVARYLLARADRELAGDALARTFEVAWRRIEDVPDEPLPWLFGVARRVLADERRGQGRRDALVERMRDGVREVELDHTPWVLERDAVVSAVGRLSERQREALLLVAWDGLSEREAASVLGCSRGAVALRLHRARRQLRATLDRTGDDARLVASPRTVHPCPKEAP